jgi:DNA polymerase III delta subunit
MPLFLFTGEEYTLLLQELTKRKSSFLEKYGEYGLFDFASDELQLDQIQSALMSWGMFASKKLVIIRGIPLDSTPHNKAKTADIERCLSLLEAFLATNDSETIVVCISYKPDKRTKPYKRFVSNAQLKEFPLLDEKQQVAYVQQQLGTLLTSGQQAELVTSCGDDLGHLSHECDKLRHYAAYHQLSSFTDAQLDRIVRWSISSNNFTLLDHLYTDTKKSIWLITTAQQAGEDSFKFLGMLYRGLKITINIINLAQEGITDAKTLASRLKAHPFVVSKQLKLLPQTKAKKEAIFELYSDILTIDHEIKTGVLPAEWFRLAVKQAVQKLT